MQTYNFINPYNFIPLQDKKSPYVNDKSAAKGEAFTGVIEYSLLTKTPLFITNGNSIRQYEDGESILSFYDFYSYEDHTNDDGFVLNPVIPGNKIKGMFRSNYEILSNSCMLYWDKDDVYSRRSLSKFERGTIRVAGEKDGKKIYELYDSAENPNLISRNLEIEALDRNLSKFEDQSYIGKTVLKPKDDSPEEKARIEELMERIEKAKARAEKINRCKENWAAFKKGDTDSFQVYYRILEGESEDDYIMLSFEPFTREVYQNRFQDIIGDFGLCKKDAYCPACSLFGRPAVQSQIRFTDLTCEERETEDLFEEKRTFPVARVPRTKCAEFYLKKPSEDATFWTSDYWIDRNGKVHRQSKDVPMINGRKFYWHQMSVLKDTVTKEDKKCWVRPVKANIRFYGKVYFDRITLEQLNELIYLINAGDYGKLDTKTHGYKLGRGKPFGYGSIALSVDKVKVRRIIKKKYEEPRKSTIELTEKLFDLNENNKLFTKEVFDSSIKDSFEKITDFFILEKFLDGDAKISYPLKEKDGAELTEREKVLNWFSSNRVHDKEAGYDTYMEYLEPLSPFLQKLEKADDTKKE